MTVRLLTKWNIMEAFVIEHNSITQANCEIFTVIEQSFFQQKSYFYFSLHEKLFQLLLLHFYTVSTKKL